MMRRPAQLVGVAACALALGCAGASNNNPPGGDGSGGGTMDLLGLDLFGVDLSGAPVDDLLGQDFAGTTPDLLPPPPPDMMTPRPDGPSVPFTVNWHLKDCYIAAMSCGFSMTCALAGATTVTLTATSETSGASFMTKLPCPSTDSNGSGAIMVPNDPGPFTYKGVVDGVPTSKSELVCHAPEGVLINVNLYAKGCDDPKCMACM